MNDVSITLPMAVPGKEYIIQSIKKGAAVADTFRGDGSCTGSKKRGFKQHLYLTCDC